MQTLRWADIHPWTLAQTQFTISWTAPTTSASSVSPLDRCGWWKPLTDNVLETLRKRKPSRWQMASRLNQSSCRPTSGKFIKLMLNRAAAEETVFGLYLRRRRRPYFLRFLDSCSLLHITEACTARAKHPQRWRFVLCECAVSWLWWIQIRVVEPAAVILIMTLPATGHAIRWTRHLTSTLSLSY